MTVDERAKSLIRAVMAAWCEDTSPDELMEVVAGNLQALIFAESERAAAVLEDEAEECGELQVAGLLRGCAETILRTSPGKGGA